MNLEETATLDYYYSSDLYSLFATLCDKNEVRNFTKTFLPIAYSLICVLGLVGNISVVMTFVFYKKSDSITDICLCNMAVVDTLFILTLPFWAVNYALDNWIFGDFICKLIKGTYAINFNCNMLFLTCISIDRYIAIVQAITSFKFRAKALAYRKIICLVVWIFSVLISSFAFVFSGSYVHFTNGTNYVCEHKSHIDSNISMKLLTLCLQLVFGFFVPLVSMSFCYIFIVKALIQAQNSKKNKAICVIVSIVIVFVVCQVPYNTVILLTMMSIGKLGKTCQNEKQMAYTKYITETLAFFHSCLNPVLYAFIGVKFRQHFVEMVRNLFCVRYRINGTILFLWGGSESASSRQTSEICE